MLIITVRTISQAIDELAKNELESIQGPPPQMPNISILRIPLFGRGIISEDLRSILITV